LIDYKEKKWTWITALQTNWTAPSPYEVYTIDAERNFTRLLQADAFHIDYNESINMNSDIYVIVSFWINNLDKEIALAKKLKSLNKKVVICYSADLRFLIGNCFISPEGTLYTELCKYADVILSGTGKEVI